LEVQLMSNVLVRVRRIWRDHVAGPTLRSYDEACEELGGVPWRPAQDETDRWFLTTRPHPVLPLPSFEKLATLDTGALKIKRSLSTRTKLVFVGGAALLAVALLAMVLSGGAQASTASATPPATAPTATAAPVATVVPPPATTPRVTPPPPVVTARAAQLARPAPTAPAVAVRKHPVARKRRR
jgi:hypothetical protein